jgi:hypothetical protein
VTNEQLLIEARDAMADGDRRLLKMFADGRYIERAEPGYRRSAGSVQHVNRLIEAGYIEVDGDPGLGSITVTGEGDRAVSRWFREGRF